MTKRLRRLLPSRLGAALLLYILCALAVSAALYFALQYVSGALISRNFSNSSVSEEHTALELAAFQEYVTANSITSRDTGKIQSWVVGEKYVLMNIYKDSFLVYSSSAPRFMNYTTFRAGESTPPWRQLYDVTFADGVGRVDIVWLASSSYYEFALVSDLLISFGCFMMIFLLLLGRKVSYINHLARELKVLEGGDLSRAVTVRGNDELADLALGIDEMRKSFLDRMNREKEAYTANSELITSISHDLRTPLTLLIGYLDIIACGKYAAPEQLERYIGSSREKAYQIKELSDKLFEYFLVYGPTLQEPEKGAFDSGTLLTQLIGEHVLSLQDQGFTVRLGSETPHAVLKLNLIAVRRVFDNLFGNIKKYADPASPVDISFERTGESLWVVISNTVREGGPSAESTGIGFKICEKIMAQHHGSFRAVRDGRMFTATVCFEAGQEGATESPGFPVPEGQRV